MQTLTTNFDITLLHHGARKYQISAERNLLYCNFLFEIQQKADIKSVPNGWNMIFERSKNVCLDQIKDSFLSEQSPLELVLRTASNKKIYKKLPQFIAICQHDNISCISRLKM